ncbi:uncharacterized protein LOC113003029 isoform X2 [Solenopsis invicta]|uniref:uncharacterized protein LOC113003029 isoform X2 n=1 Tax=Solenopsis invicta TaxID=13686 RepID=UPI00193DAD15|nr:uncharacterized protein LOC113003029 isoform X2 [Solenopsis invicta]
MFSSICRFKNPVYGTNDFKYTNYAIPPYILSLVFFMGITVSTSLIITVRFEGVWDRNIGSKGSIFVVSFLLFLNGSCGMMFGFVISSLCKTHSLAYFSSAESFLLLLTMNKTVSHNLK